MKLYITRHGQTDWNLNRKIQGKVDIPLNDTGRKQAEITREELRGIDIDIIISSPLQRAYETAQIINKSYHVDIITDERIAERGFGDLEGSQIQDLDFTHFWRMEEEHRFPSCEPTSLFYQRVYDFIDDIRQTRNRQTVLVVAHGGVSLPFYTYVNGMPSDKDMRRYMLDNCEVTCYELL